MTLRRAQITSAIQELLQQAVYFPTVVEIDSADAENFQPIDGFEGMAHSANITTGDFEPTHDPIGSDDWEGVREVMVCYAVEGPDKTARVQRAGDAIDAFAAILKADRTLGLGDPQVWAEISPGVEEGDDGSAGATAPVAFARIPIAVTYVAASAAG